MKFQSLLILSVGLLLAAGTTRDQKEVQAGTDDVKQEVEIVVGNPKLPKSELNVVKPRHPEPTELELKRHKAEISRSCRWKLIGVLMFMAMIAFGAAGGYLISIARGQEGIILIFFTGFSLCGGVVVCKVVAPVRREELIKDPKLAIGCDHYDARIDILPIPAAEAPGPAVADISDIDNAIFNEAAKGTIHSIDIPIVNTAAQFDDILKQIRAAVPSSCDTSSISSDCSTVTTVSTSISTIPSVIDSARKVFEKSMRELREMPTLPSEDEDGESISEEGTFDTLSQASDSLSETIDEMAAYLGDAKPSVMKKLQDWKAELADFAVKAKRRRLSQPRPSMSNAPKAETC